MKIRNKTIWKIGGFSLATASRVWLSTLDYQATYYDPTVDTPREDFDGPVIYLLWHDQILFPFYLRGHNRTAILVSQHADARWLSEAARHMGFEVVHGSSKRGGVAALRELMRRSQGMSLAVTPDGPRGPRRKLAAGAIYLSSKLQIPLVCMGSAYQHPWRMPTWDRFAMPKPFSRARAVVGPRMQIPADLDREGVEAYRRQTEGMLNFVTQAAQTWADEGGRYEQQWPIGRTPAPNVPFRNLTDGRRGIDVTDESTDSVKLSRAA